MRCHRALCFETRTVLLSDGDGRALVFRELTGGKSSKQDRKMQSRVEKRIRRKDIVLSH